MTIKELRKQRGLTQMELADKAGLHISQIRKIERGEIKVGNMTFTNAINLLAALHPITNDDVSETLRRSINIVRLLGTEIFNNEDEKRED